VSIESVLKRIERGGRLGVNETIEILDEVLAFTKSASTADEMREVAEKAQGLKIRIQQIDQAEVLRAQSKSEMRLAASRPSQFSPHYSIALEKAQRAKELLRGIVPNYTPAEREAWLEFAKKFAGKRR